MASKKQKTVGEDAVGGDEHEKAKSKAKDYIDNPEKLASLYKEASNKAQRNKGPLDGVWDRLTASLRLIKAYSNGSYRAIPWQSLLMLVTAVTYFVMPVDMIPDIILALGYVDDAAVLGWTFRTVSSDIEAFLDWESSQTSGEDPPISNI